MEITNNQVSSYGYNTNAISSTQTNRQNTTASFDNYLEEHKVFENTKLLTSDILSFIDKNDGFSSVLPENEKLFREVLADDKIYMQEVKHFTYDQAKEFNEFLRKSMTLDMTTYIPVYQYEEDADPRILLGASTISYDEDFNKAFFETLKNMNNTKESHDLYNAVSDSLGYNNRYLFVPEPKEEYFEQRTAMEIEKYKDYENPEEYITDYTKWEIKDYGAFIQEMLTDYKKYSQLPFNSLEKSVQYKNIFKNLLDLEKNYNAIKK
ncbi:MAG: hypothetical protein WC149_06370 [Arcobacteraceae bacterium]